jgi:hypothetical protein
MKGVGTEICGERERESKEEDMKGEKGRESTCIAFESMQVRVPRQNWSRYECVRVDAV